MEKLVLLTPSVNSSSIVFTRDGDMNVVMTAKFKVPSDPYNPPNGEDGQTVISDGNLRISSAKVVAVNNATDTEFTITGRIESKKPNSGLMALKFWLGKIKDDEVKDALEKILLV